MTVEITRPELEHFVEEEIRNGHFESVDELFAQALGALREKYQSSRPLSTPADLRKNLAEFLLQSPFAGSDLFLERQQDFGRPLEL
jgi:Arc/MetJ-type ribon-helix-helix transcriptional regulator